jgi:hypothetical protein
MNLFKICHQDINDLIFESITEQVNCRNFGNEFYLRARNDVQLSIEDYFLLYAFAVHYFYDNDMVSEIVL